MRKTVVTKVSQPLFMIKGWILDGAVQMDVHLRDPVLGKLGKFKRRAASIQKAKGRANLVSWYIDSLFRIDFDLQLSSI